MGEIYVDTENTTDDNIRCIDAIRVLHENVFIHGYAKHKNKLDRGSMSKFRRVCPALTILGEISTGKKALFNSKTGDNPS